MISLRFQQPSGFDTGSKTRAVYLYSFTRYFDWPDEKKDGNFIIYVVGKNENLMTELKKLASTKKVGNQDIEVKNSMDYNPSISPNIIYFSPNTDMKPINEAASKSKNKGVLLVAESPGAIGSAGASVNFLVVDSKVKFDYSKSAAVKAGLKTNEDFKSLANKTID